jgi:NADH-quinone oxidoreductase subunit M
MLKMGIYSVIRWILPIVPLGVADWGKVAIILSVSGIVYASWIAISQKDMKRLFAYSSIAHVGLIAAGIFSLTEYGLQGSMIQMLSHGINVIGLFFVAQIIFDRAKTTYIPDLGGIINKAPVFGIFFLIILFGSVALPLTNGFIGEFMLLFGVYEYSTWLSAVAGLTIILGAVYMLKTYQWSMLGELNPNITSFEDVKPTEAVVLFTICGLILFIGIYPKPFLDLTEPSIKHLLESAYPTLTLK